MVFADYKKPGRTQSLKVKRGTGPGGEGHGEIAGEGGGGPV